MTTHNRIKKANYFFNITIKGLLIIYLLSLLSQQSALGQFIDTKWKITKFIGEEWLEKPTNAIGKIQEFYKGWSDGYFYNCDYQGQSATYTKYSMKQFLGNPEFIVFSKNKEQLNLKNGNVFVHRITCAGNKKVFYPFVTIEPSNKAYYLFEGGVFIFERE